MVSIAADAADAGEHGLRLIGVRAENDVAVKTVLPQIIRSVGQSVGTIAVSSLDLTQPVRYGANKTVARIRLEADERNQLLQAMRLTNDGSARGTDLQNIRILSSRGQVLTDTAASLEHDTVLLTFDPPLSLEDGSAVVLTVKADIRASRRRTIRLLIDDPSDIQATPARGSR